MAVLSTHFNNCTFGAMESILTYITWSPDPEIISLGPISLRWYSMMFLAGFVIGFQIMKRFFIHEKQPVEWLDSLLIYLMVGTIVGARLGHCFFYDAEYYFADLPNFIEIFIPVRFGENWPGQFGDFTFTGFRGLASHGGAIAIIIMMFLFARNVAKKPVLWILDRVVIPIALTGMFIRLGNLMNSEIVGNITDVPWAFIFEEVDDNPRHAVQLYESISYLLIFVFLMWQYWKTEAKDKLGLLFGQFLVLLWSARFVLEYFKRSQGGFESAFGNLLSTGQLLSIPFIIAGLYFIFSSKNKNVTV